MIEVDVCDVVDLLLQDTNKVQFNFCPEKFNIKAEIIVYLIDGLSPIILTLELELMDSNHVSIVYKILYKFKEKNYF